MQREGGLKRGMIEVEEERRRGDGKGKLVNGNVVVNVERKEEGE